MNKFQKDIHPIDGRRLRRSFQYLPVGNEPGAGVDSVEQAKQAEGGQASSPELGRVLGEGSPEAEEAIAGRAQGVIDDEWPWEEEEEGEVGIGTGRGEEEAFPEPPNEEDVRGLGSREAEAGAEEDEEAEPLVARVVHKKAEEEQEGQGSQSRRRLVQRGVSKRCRFVF